MIYACCSLGIHVVYLCKNSLKFIALQRLKFYFTFWNVEWCGSQQIVGFAENTDVYTFYIEQNTQ